MNKQEYDSKIVNVYGDKQAKEKNRIPAYQRQLSTRPVTFTCVVCQRKLTQERYPGPTPRYCSEECFTKHEKERNEERVRKQREKRREQAAQRKTEKAHASDV
jgi:hypothetical protein